MTSDEYAALVAPLYAGRAYHNMEHVRFMLEHIPPDVQGPDFTAMNIAILLHDAHPDEEDCVKLIDNETPDHVLIASLIRATKFDNKSFGVLGALIHDLDYLILSEDYEGYRARVWDEYGIEKDRFRRKVRREILIAMLSQPIFVSYWFAPPVEMGPKTYEIRAIAGIVGELRMLEG